MEWGAYMGVPALVGPELNSDENANYASLLLNLIARGFTGPVSFFLPLSRSTGFRSIWGIPVTPTLLRRGDAGVTSMH